MWATAFLKQYAIELLADVVRYFVFAGLPFLIFYVAFKLPLLRFKIQQKFPELNHVRREILYSLSSMAIFTLVGTSVFMAQQNGYTRIYTNIHQYSIAYLVFSIILFIVVHDAYFYWTHRLMHHKALYRHVHLIHHKSINPTPWAVYSFHPFEAVVQVLILPIMVFTVPLHPLAIVIWGMYQLILNVGGHLGFELFRSGFTQRLLTRWHNTSTHHNMHHKYVACNYGLYFNVWDRLMGTNHSRYNEEFEEVCKRREGGKLQQPELTEQASQTTA